MKVFENLYDKFYDKVVADDALEPVFKDISLQHKLHTAHFVAEASGGLNYAANRMAVILK